MSTTSPVSTVHEYRAHGSMGSGLRAALDVKRKDSASGETIIWGEKTYRITVKIKGQVHNPKTPGEWDQFKIKHKAFLDTVDKVERIRGSSRIHFNSSANSLSVSKKGETTRNIDLEHTFQNADPQVKAEYETHKKDVVSFIFKSFTSTLPVATNETKKPDANNTVANDQTNAARAARLASDQCLEDGDIVSFLEQLKNDPTEGHRLAFAYVSPRDQAGQPVPLDFVAHFHAEHIKNTALQAGGNMVFAMPYLVDATPAQAGHYKLVLINFADSTIYHYDSLGSAPKAPVQTQLTSLAKELESKYGKPFKIAAQGNAVHQTDSTSCGHFVLSCVVAVLTGATPSDFMSGQISAQQLSDQKQALASFYRAATAQAAVVTAPASSTNSSTTASTTPVARTSVPSPAATPLTLTDFGVHPDEEQAPSGILGTVAAYLPKRLTSYFSGSDENTDGNLRTPPADPITDF